jgi:tetratricopeptide (TPR) repeat protein
MTGLVDRTAALHAAFWQYDPWYRRAWFVWPQALAALLAGWLMAGRLPQVVSGNWGKAANCAVASNPDCAATKRITPDFPNEIVNPTLANRSIITVDQTAFASSAATDRQRLTAALAAYYRSESQQGIDVLKPADANDRNVQFMLGLLDLGSNTYDSVRVAQGLLRTAADAGQRQAAVVLGGTLMGWLGLPKDVPQGRGLIEKGAAAGDSYAMRLAAIGYLSGEFGAHDPAKAFGLMRQAADGGDPIAMAHLAWLYYSGPGGIARDETKAIDYLHRAAETGVTSIQNMIAVWAWNRYATGEPQDPSEFFKWNERAFQRGHSVLALGYLAFNYWFVRAPWTDTARSFSLLQLCARYAYGYCHYWLGEAFYSGSGTPKDLVKAYAAYTVARQLGSDASRFLQELDASMLPEAKTAATELARKVSAGLSPVPAVIELQTAEAIAGGWIWNLPQPQANAVPVQPSTKQDTQSNTAPVQPSSKTAATESADGPACQNGDGDPDVGISACERVIGSGVTGTELGWAHYWNGWHNGRKQQHDPAISHYGEAIRLQTNLSWARNNRGVEFLRLGNLDAALRDFSEVIAADPSFPLAYANLGEIFLRQNQPDKAIADATQALRLDPKLQYAYDVRSVAYENKQQWTEVVADCTSALGLYAKDINCLSRRGNAYNRMGKSDLALADFNESLRLEPQSPWTLVMRGNLRKDNGQADLAINDYTQAISQDPNNEDAYAYRADAFAMTAQYDRAIADATKTIELDPKWSFGYIVRGRAQTELGHPEVGVRDLYQAISLDPKNAYAHYFNGIAEARLEESRYANCPKPNQRSNTIVGAVPPICMIGIRYVTAIAELDQAIQLSPNYDHAYALRGALYLSLRQGDRGVADLRKALAINPQNEFARRQLRSIHVSP